jgi:hypothetical protein
MARRIPLLQENFDGARERDYDKQNRKIESFRIWVTLGLLISTALTIMHRKAFKRYRLFRKLTIRL